MQSHASLKERGRGRFDHTEEKATWRWSRGRIEDAGLEDCRGGATSQGMPAATRKCKRQGADSTLEPLEEAQSSDTDFQLSASRTVRE